jgi:GDP-L-fucose synthase
MNYKEKIYIAGHNGMVGSAIIRRLRELGYQQLITQTRSELDLTNQEAVSNFIKNERPNQIYIAAARVGGIHANATYPANFIYENIMIEANIIHQAFTYGVKKLLFLGSSCIYPRLAKQPMSENSLLTGKLEPTNESYAIAKIAGIKLCEGYNRQYGDKLNIDYRSVMPTNLYGPGDHYYSENSHVIPALITRFHEAKTHGLNEVVIWGSGKAKREFMHVDDLADAAVFIMHLEKEKYYKETSLMESHVNLGFGDDISIKSLAKKIARIVGYKGIINFDISKPDGAPRKLMDSSKINKLGWLPKINIEEGLHKTYKEFLNDRPSALQKSKQAS